MKRTYPVEVLWCSNVRQGRSNRWSFPPNVRRQIEADCAGKSVLHLFGGLATFGTRLDIDAQTRPHVIGDAWLPPFARESFDVIVMDPPYFHVSRHEQLSLFRQAGWIARERVLWFSTVWMSQGAGLKPEKAYLVRVGDSCLVRCLQYFRVAERCEPVNRFTRGPAMKYNRWLIQPRSLQFPAEEPRAAESDHDSPPGTRR